METTKPKAAMPAPRSLDLDFSLFIDRIEDQSEMHFRETVEPGATETVSGEMTNARGKM